MHAEKTLSLSPRAVFALKLNERLYFGWVILVVSSLVVFCSGPGQSHTFGVYFGPLSEHLAISNTAVATLYALATLVAATGLPYLGTLIDRLSSRVFLLLIAVGVGTLAMGFSLVSHVVLLLLGFALLRLIAHGGLTIAGNNLAANWFAKKRGLALSVTGMGFAASMAIHPPLSQYLIEHYGWQQAWVFLGLMTWLLLIPLAFFFVHDKPEDLGLLPDGEPHQDDSATNVTEPDASAETGLTRTQAMRTATFWLLANGQFWISAFLSGLLMHQVAVFTHYGMKAQFAASLLSVSAVVMALLIPLIGLLLDRISTKTIYSTTLLALGCASLSLTFFTTASWIVVYSILLGTAAAGVHATFTYIWARYFGRKHLGSLQGASHFIIVVGSAVGAIPLAAGFDLTGSYRGVLILQAIILFVSAVTIGFVSEPLKTHQRN